MNKPLFLLAITILFSAQSTFAQTEEVQPSSEEVTPATQNSQNTSRDFDILKGIQEKIMVNPEITLESFTEEEQEVMKRHGQSSNGSLEEEATSPEIARCFDYYTFGSVQVDVEAQLGGTVAGSEIDFQGFVRNDNDYPLVDGRVFVKVFRKDAELSQIQGHHLVDQFIVLDDITLQAHGEKLISFSWQSPAHALPGEYQLATFFITSEKFNLLGLSFTDDVVGNTVDFTLLSEVETSVFFDKESVLVNNSPYFFAAYPPRVSERDPVTVTMDIVNTTENEAPVLLTYTLYQWDMMSEGNKLHTQSDYISLKAGERRALSYTTDKMDHAVYFLVIESIYNNTKSVLDVRYVREGVEGIRLNFPSITTFPLTSGMPTTLFSCVHGTGMLPVVPNNRLVLTLTDENEEVIHTYTFEGDITGSMMAVKTDFTPERTYSTVTLNSELYHNDILVDSATIRYDCKEIDPSLCQTQTTSGAETKDFGSRNSILLVSIFLIALGIVVLILRNVITKQHHENVQ